MANEIEERARNSLTDYRGLRHRSIEESKTAQFKQLVARTYFVVG